MTKREYIVEVLSRLKPYRPMAEGLSQLIAEQSIDNNSINGLVAIFEQVFAQTIEASEKKRFGASLVALKKIQTLEEKEQEENRADLEAVEKLIADI